MRVLTISAAVLLGAALSTANAQIGASHTTPLTKSFEEKGQSGPGMPGVSGGSDSCATATAISGAGTFSGDNLGATTDGPAGCSALEDVWYDWTATATGNTVFSFCAAQGGTANYDSYLAVYDTAACFGPQLACNDDFCALQSQVTVSVTSGNVYKIRIGGFGGANGSYTLSINPPAPPPANDSCATPTAIAGLGTFPFNNTGATTGVEGQNEAICFFFGSDNIDNDLWYEWTAPATGLATLDLCGQTTLDSKVAVYPGSGCPADGTSLACNDDSCGFQSGLSFAVTGGSVYTIQLGSFPGAGGGSGTFELDIPPPPGPCDVYHDGSSEDAIGLTAGGDICWMHREGTPGGYTYVTGIATAYGTAAFPGTGGANGQATTLALWDDPNDDGNPIDGVLLAQIPSTVQNVDTDILNLTSLATPIGVSGFYFIGVVKTQPAGQFPAPWDNDNGASGGRAWAAGSGAGAFNFNNLGANSLPPGDIDTFGLPGLWLLHATCAPFAITASCDGAAGCPCGNNGAPGNGCANSVNPAGANLAITGNASLGGDTLVLTASGLKPSYLVLFWQGSNQITPVFAGDGLRCWNGNLKRMYLVKNAPATTAVVPPGSPPGNPTVSGQSAALGDPLSAGSVRGYFAFYRDSNLSFCPDPPGGSFNSTNAVSVGWGL